MKPTDKELFRMAVKASENAYVPFSNFHVGAALLCRDGSVYTGCNVENAAYPAGNCAERTAIFKAVSEGKRDFEAICIVGGPEGVIQDFCPPCGICRQAMAEFCAPASFEILLAKSPEEYRRYTLSELLPLGFAPGHLQ